MKKWQSILNQHCNAEVLNDNASRVNSASWNPDTLEGFDDYVTYNLDIRAYVVDTVKESDRSTIVETNTYKSIYDYLGY